MNANNAATAAVPIVPAPVTDEQGAATKSWKAAIELTLRSGPTRTDLAHVLHQGPLRIQRPFYPEGECCHVYLLHPPGGMVPGDELRVSLNLESRAETLVTTPSAGKAYCSDMAKTAQQQGIHADLKEAACLEWLPQETIVFEGAEVLLDNSFTLAPDAKLFAWDIVVLGRRASGEDFRRGQCLQRFSIEQHGRPLLKERTLWQGGAPLLDADWGMAGRSVCGSLFATLRADRDMLDRLRDDLAQQPYFALCGGEWGLSQRRDLFMARYIGDSPEHCRKGFELIWRRLRPSLNGRVACRPRIWNT